VAEQLLSSSDELIQLSEMEPNYDEGLQRHLSALRHAAAVEDANLHALEQDAAALGVHKKSATTDEPSSIAHKIATFVDQTKNHTLHGGGGLSLPSGCSKGRKETHPSWHTLSMFGNALGVHVLHRVVGALDSATTHGSLASQIPPLMQRVLSCDSMLPPRSSDVACHTLTIAASLAQRVTNGSIAWLESMSDGDHSKAAQEFLLKKLRQMMLPHMEVDLLLELQASSKYVRSIQTLGKRCDPFLCFVAHKVEIAGCNITQSTQSLSHRLKTELMSKGVTAETSIDPNGAPRSSLPLPSISRMCINHSMPSLKSRMDEAALSKHSHAPPSPSRSIKMNSRMVIAIMPTLGNVALDIAADKIEQELDKFAKRRSRMKGTPRSTWMIARVRRVSTSMKRRTERRLQHQLKRLLGAFGSKKVRPISQLQQLELSSIDEMARDLSSRAARHHSGVMRRRLLQMPALGYSLPALPKILAKMATLMAKIVVQMVVAIVTQVVMMVIWLVKFAIVFIPRLDMPNIGMALSKGAAAKVMEITVKSMYKSMNKAKFNLKAAQMGSKTYTAKATNNDKPFGVAWEKPKGT
jgi:hypothetical protein